MKNKSTLSLNEATIINIIAGLVVPSGGTILIDNINYKEIKMKSLHKLISYVPQNIYLMDD